jgi:hypothetical protein
MRPELIKNSFLNRLPILAAVFVLTAIQAFGLSGNTSEGDLIKRQQQYFEHIKNKKYDAAADDLAENYVGVYADGIIDRTRELKDLKTFSEILADYQISQEKVTFTNPKTAIVTFHLHVKVSVNGKDFFEDDNVACVWTLNKKQWRMASQAAVKVHNNS